MANSEPLEPPMGRYSARLDEKGRVKLPEPFQQYFAQLGGPVFVTSQDAAELRTQAEMDGHGRILLDATLRETLQLETESKVLLYWYRNHLEIISEKVFQERRKGLSRRAKPREFDALRRAGLM